MPQFELLSAQEAAVRSSQSKRSKAIAEYIDYINRLGKDQAGRLSPASGESVIQVRRRLGAAAKALGRDITIKRVEEDIYFWVAPSGNGRRGRRGRPRKNETPS